MPKFDIVFCSKGANSSGVQIADLIARPIGLNVLRPGQENRAYEIIRKKFWRGEPTGDVFFDTNLVNPIGLKVFP